MAGFADYTDKVLSVACPKCNAKASSKCTIVARGHGHRIGDLAARPHSERTKVLHLVPTLNDEQNEELTRMGRERLKMENDSNQFVLSSEQIRYIGRAKQHLEQAGVRLQEALGTAALDKAAHDALKVAYGRSERLRKDLLQFAVGEIVHGLTLYVPTAKDAAAELALERLSKAREAVIGLGYFTEDQVSDDVAPRIFEYGAHLKQERAQTMSAVLSMLQAIRSREPLNFHGAPIPKFIEDVVGEWRNRVYAPDYMAETEPQAEPELDPSMTQSAVDPRDLTEIMTVNVSNPLVQNLNTQGGGKSDASLMMMADGVPEGTRVEFDWNTPALAIGNEAIVCTPVHYVDEQLRCNAALITGIAKSEDSTVASLVVFPGAGLEIKTLKERHERLVLPDEVKPAPMEDTWHLSTGSCVK